MKQSLTLSKGRVEALSDGIFAIAMTLLVLKLEVPALMHHSSNQEMLQQLLDQGPAFLSYVVTFLIAGLFWFLHHLTFHFIRNTDGWLCAINLGFLMFVALLPFSAGLLGHLSMHPVSQLFYFGNQLAIAVLLYVHWRYARSGGMLVADADPSQIRLVSYRVGGLALGFAASLLAAWLVPMFGPAPVVVASLIMVLAEVFARRKRKIREPLTTNH